MTKITQADRDAAAEHISAMGLANSVINGKSDNHTLVRAFAKHRLKERAAIVEWFRRTAEGIKKDAEAGFWDEFTESEIMQAIEDENTNARLIEEGAHLR